MEKINLRSLIISESILKFQYTGYLGIHNKPLFCAKSYVFQSCFGIVHVHISLN